MRPQDPLAVLSVPKTYRLCGSYRFSRAQNHFKHLQLLIGMASTPCKIQLSSPLQKRTKQHTRWCVIFSQDSGRKNACDREKTPPFFLDVPSVPCIKPSSKHRFKQGHTCSRETGHAIVPSNGITLDESTADKLITTLVHTLFADSILNHIPREEIFHLQFNDALCVDVSRRLNEGVGLRLVENYKELLWRKVCHNHILITHTLSHRRIHIHDNSWLTWTSRCVQAVTSYLQKYVLASPFRRLLFNRLTLSNICEKSHSTKSKTAIAAALNWVGTSEVKCYRWKCRASQSCPR